MRSSSLTKILAKSRSLALLAAMAAQACQAQAPLELELPALRDAAQRGNLRAVEAARARFAGHPLEAYPSYWLLVAQLERGADRAEVQQFLARHGGSPLAESLRREWLKALGASQSWETFRAEHPKHSGDDAEVACYALQERLARSDAEANAEARALFLAGREAPAACDPVFNALATAKNVSQDEVWARARRLLAANAVPHAKRTLALLPRKAIDEKTIDRAAQDPAAFLAREKSPLLARPARELVLFALGRLARSKPDEAAERLAMFSSRLGPDDTRFAWAQVAHQAALVHSPRALEWYNEAGVEPLTDAQRAW